MKRRSFLGLSGAALLSPFVSPAPDELLGCRWTLVCGDYHATVTIGEKVIRASRGPKVVRIWEAA